MVVLLLSVGNRGPTVTRASQMVVGLTGLPGSRPAVWRSSGDDDLLLRCWLAGLGPGCRPVVDGGLVRTWSAGPGGGYRVPARLAPGPANQPIGVVAAVGLTRCKVPGRRERGA